VVGDNTLQIGALFLPEQGASILHTLRQAHLNIPTQSLLALSAALQHRPHRADPLLTRVEVPRDLASQPLDLPLVHGVVVKAWQNVFVVQALQLGAFARDPGKKLRHLVADVAPPRREKVHFDHGIAAIVVFEQAAPVIVEDAAVRVGEARAFGRVVVRVGLPVRDVAELVR
jgi:hypothetical protein